MTPVCQRWASLSETFFAEQMPIGATDIPSGAKARLIFAAIAARLKSCPFTKLAHYQVFPQAVKLFPFKT
jgi:hypothetical protein